MEWWWQRGAELTAIHGKAPEEMGDLKYDRERGICGGGALCGVWVFSVTE